jgi:hypothetical protein
MFGFPLVGVLHFFGWPLGWIVLTLIWANRERQKEIKEDAWIAEHIMGERSESDVRD